MSDACTVAPERKQKFDRREYQIECIDTVNNLPDGSRGIVALATGLGKTYVASRFDRKGRLLFLSHRDELVRQPQRYFEGVSFGIEKAEEHSDGEDIVSASVQTLCRDARLRQFTPDDFDMIIVDEAHHAAAPTYKKIIGYFHPRLLIGLTATPRRGDGVKLNDVFDKIVFQRDLLWGIRNGYLSNVRCMAVEPDSVDISGVNLTAGDFNQKQLSERIDIQAMFDTIAKTYEDYCYGKDRSTIIYCLSVKGCYGAMGAIKDRIPKKDWKTLAIITGDTPADERRDLEEKYLNGEIRCLINCMVLTEGTDLPRTNAIIIARPTTNNVLYTQIVGRGCRPFEGKTECLVLDILPASKRRICSATTLAGLDWDDLDKNRKAQIEQEGIDLLTLADEVADATKRVVSLAVQELDLFEDMYKEETAMIHDSLNTGSVKVFADNITTSNAEKVERAMEADGISDFLGMRVEIGRSDTDRYIIRGSLDGYEFHISSPDMLGKVHVKAYIGTKVYATGEPVPMDEAIVEIKKILFQDCERFQWMWDKNRIQEWNDIPASSKQLRYARSLSQKIPDVDIEADMDWEQQFSKYQMHAMIDFLLQHKENKARLKELKKAVKEAKKKKGCVPEEIKEPKKENAHSFEDFSAKYEHVQLPAATKHKPPKMELVVAYTPKTSPYYLQEQAATRRQIDYLTSLLDQLRGKGAACEEDFSKYKVSGDVSILIDFLRWLIYDANIAYARKPKLDLAPICAFIEDSNARKAPSPIKIQVEYTPLTRDTSAHAE